MEKEQEKGNENTNWYFASCTEFLLKPMLLNGKKVVIPSFPGDCWCCFLCRIEERFIMKNIIKQREKFSWDRMVETIESLQWSF